MTPQAEAAWAAILQIESGVRVAWVRAVTLGVPHAFDANPELDMGSVVRADTPPLYPFLRRIVVVEPSATGETVIGLCKRIYTDRVQGNHVPLKLLRAFAPHLLNEPARAGQPGVLPAQDELASPAVAEMPGGPCPHCGQARARGLCPQAVACPRCQAKPDSKCRRPSAHECSWHSERVRAAEQQDAAACPGFEPVETPNGIGCLHCSGLPDDHPKAAPEPLGADPWPAVAAHLADVASEAASKARTTQAVFRVVEMYPGKSPSYVAQATTHPVPDGAREAFLVAPDTRLPDVALAAILEFSDRFGSGSNHEDVIRNDHRFREATKQRSFFGED